MSNTEKCFGYALVARTVYIVEGTVSAGGSEQLPVAVETTEETAQGQWWLITTPNPSTAGMGLSYDCACLVRCSSML